MSRWVFAVWCYQCMDKKWTNFIPTEDVIPANPNLELYSFSQDPVPLTDFLKELGEFIDIKLF